MQINITNGTLTQIQETLTASSGYTLPTTISVSGATSNYNSTTGAITLTNLTSTMSITASGESQATGISNIFFGSSQMASAYYGNNEISQIWLGNVKLYEGTPATSGYEVELSGSMGDGEMVYVQINDDPTWYYANMHGGNGFTTSDTNIPDVYEKTANISIGIANVSKIKIGTAADPRDYSGPFYDSSASSHNFVGLTFYETGGYTPAYATDEITMTHDSKIVFQGDR